MVQQLDKALAAANLLNMGFDAGEVLSIADQWALRQSERTLKNLSAYAKSIEVNDTLPFDGLAKLFVSFHYSSYAHLYRAIASRSRERTIMSLVGSQSSSHQTALSQLAAQFDFEIQFVESSFGMVKRMRQALQDGCYGIILLDIPWSKGEAQPDTRFSAKPGVFHSLSTMLRLISLIDRNYSVVCAQRTGQSINLRAVSANDFDQAFAHLGELIMEQPEEYERLHQMHKFCTLKHARDARVHFSGVDGRYAVDAKTMKLYRTTSPVAALKDNPQNDLEVEIYG